MGSKRVRLLTWNNRIIRYNDGSLAIHEVHYGESGEPEMVTVDAVPVAGNDLDDLRGDYDQKENAFGKPILDYDSFRTA